MGPNAFRALLFLASTASYVNALSIVSPLPAGWTLVGCLTEATTGRALNQDQYYDNVAMTEPKCMAYCQSKGYIYAGVEYYQECYCGNTLQAGSVTAPATDCTTACTGDQNQKCGGPNRLDVFKYTGGGTGPTTTTTTKATTTSAPPVTTTTSKSTVTATGVPTGWNYKGCFIDNANGRILSYQINPDNAALTVSSCTNACKNLGYAVAGMEYSTQCFCGNAVIAGGKVTADTDCNMACGGNPNDKCGAGNRMSIWSSQNPLVTTGVPTVQTTGLPGNWKYVGCYNEVQTGRVFPYQLILSTTNSATSCLTQCSNFGYGAGGMEYGEECYCGDARSLISSGVQKMPESDCNMPCPGNPSAICGAGNRLSYYTWTGQAPGSDWSYASGTAAGQYQFLVGGIVIPLVATPGINGKVTFVEKFGTGPPNSTGAYELDVSQIGTGASPWRTMHVKTDVFCSASLTLPDRAGRQLNIGGWSLESTYGIRLYTPDGSPGVPGKNDWQENYQEVSLQAGRWYPSAMQMTNGSILVVGGEDGSNGAPVPSLELLPRSGSTVYCDFLDRTDPYNLYPFLYTLPSGGIFIGYYNEARVLDPRTFATIKTLPKIPGAVNNPLGGRTYPLEGTSMLLPQVAPYTAPLTVILCGGSVPGPAIALDNCVTIQPDAPNPQWTLERMPSQRVISCMTALPDGTFLILNGAQQGQAGFGLATRPNLNAVLYDPSKALGSRMTVMANTTVARLYHSEAILLQDGRVMVSGSDPQDNVNPQEYRIEVFVPPYLLNGKARPSFTLSTRDWAYGGTISVNANIPSGNAGGVRVSLMGAESSTHGNSMGARTLFPAVSCNGGTCTITAPPNANICPPGWYQVFLLDGPTPSKSIFVRIGGDPGAIGNWPNFADFTKPGVGAVNLK